ncbi:SMI1/KNR4 family protein [Bradyrhizobium yuanmingense]|uniref:SMI1/KNR4 family protein n=1 Tax=Bradyrhizobium yuanmingense TaxID=108015 RepID=UPI0023B9035A|nr:SMI1/KNR4 family protein [Bradyrhizobium yuanmingense]MDF0521592.1 SMI1/KNR4 family protein [Bradyrhizobium yuanmingense]
MKMATKRLFDDFDFEGFWDDCPYSLENYVEPPPTDELIASIEHEIGGYRLPAAYVDLARRHNGGMVKRNCHPMKERTGWAEDHVAIEGLFALGRTSTYSLAGKFGAKFMIEEWGYPPIGVGIADTPAGGHELIMLDYRSCGKRGEPQVVYVDQEADYSIVVVAPDFETFIRGLVAESEYDTTEEDRAAAFATVERGTLSPILVRALAAVGDRLPHGERMLRTLARQIVDEKGFFALHDDERSHLMYGLMFWLYSSLCTARSFEAFVGRTETGTSYGSPCFELMIVFDVVTEPYGFKTRGYAEGFVRDWWDACVARGDMVEMAEGYRLTPKAEAALLGRLATIAGPEGK